MRWKIQEKEIVGLLIKATLEKVMVGKLVAGWGSLRVQDLGSGWLGGGVGNCDLQPTCTRAGPYFENIPEKW